MDPTAPASFRTKKNDAPSLPSSRSRWHSSRAIVDFPVPPPPVAKVSRDPTSDSLSFKLDSETGWLLGDTNPGVDPRRVCWVPVDRRGKIQADGFTIALGAETGIVSILSIEPDFLPVTG